MPPERPLLLSSPSDCPAQPRPQTRQPRTGSLAPQPVQRPGRSPWGPRRGCALLMPPGPWPARRRAPVTAAGACHVHRSAAGKANSLAPLAAAAPATSPPSCVKPAPLPAPALQLDHQARPLESHLPRQESEDPRAAPRLPPRHSARRASSSQPSPARPAASQPSRLAGVRRAALGESGWGGR